MEQDPSVSASYDVFISHASEDKDDVVEPLANQLEELGLSVWYDEFELDIGDSLRESIDEGLSSSEYGVAVLSSNFFGKNWTEYELNGLVSRQNRGEKTILPLWYGIDKEDVVQHSPPLADIKAERVTENNIKTVARTIQEKVYPDSRPPVIKELRNKQDVIENDLPHHTVKYLDWFYMDQYPRVRSIVTDHTSKLADREFSLDFVLEKIGMDIERQFSEEHRILDSSHSIHSINARKYVALRGLLTEMS